MWLVCRSVQANLGRLFWKSVYRVYLATMFAQLSLKNFSTEVKISCNQNAMRTRLKHLRDFYRRGGIWSVFYCNSFWKDLPSWSPILFCFAFQHSIKMRLFFVTNFTILLQNKRWHRKVTWRKEKRHQVWHFYNTNDKLIGWETTLAPVNLTWINWA